MTQKSHNHIAVVWVMRMGGGNKGMVDSCTPKNSKRIFRIGQGAVRADLKFRGREYIYIYIYRERERGRDYIIYTYIYIYCKG